ncbi:hypothetical protein CHS0354_038269, partial [Potamilus streckersoni]
KLSMFLTFPAFPVSSDCSFYHLESFIPCPECGADTGSILDCPSLDDTIHICQCY